MSVDSSSEAKSIYQLANSCTCIEIYKYIITSKTFKKSEKYENKKKKKSVWIGEALKFVGGKEECLENGILFSIIHQSRMKKMLVSLVPSKVRWRAN